VCYRCGKFGHFIAKCPYSSESDRDEDKKGKKKMEKTLEPPLNILHPMMTVALAIMKMI
jgi:hypothetical protein